MNSQLEIKSLMADVNIDEIRTISIIFFFFFFFCKIKLQDIEMWMYLGILFAISPSVRRGYLCSTLLARRAVARPHIELEICKESFSVE